MAQPKGFDDGSGRVLRLKKALYGLKQAPREWYLKLRGVLEEIGFTPSTADHSLFMLGEGEQRSFMVVYVDDILIFSPSSDLVKEVMLKLQDKFKCKALGDVSFYLWLHIERDVEKRCMRVHQRKYLEALAANFGQSEGHVATPFPSGFKCVKGPEEESVGEEERRRFHSLVGSLMYAAVNTRPDVAFATGQLARVVQCRNKEQVAAGMRVAKYLGQTATVGLQFSAAAQRRQKGADGVEPGRLFLTAFSDASYASEPEDMTSVGGFICCVGGGPTSWESKKQVDQALSSVESEYMALFRAVREIVWQRRLLAELGEEQQGPTPLYCDSQGAIALAKNLVLHGLTKHMRVKWHWTRTMVAAGEVELHYVKTTGQPADMMTKRLNVPIFDLDFDAILAAMYAFDDSAEGDYYLSVPPDPGIAAAALGASASATPGTGASADPGAGASTLSGTAPTEALHTFTLDSGASRSFFRDSTTLTPLSRPVAVSLADPSGDPVLAHSSTVLPSDLQEAWVDQFTPGGQRVTHCTCSRTGRHLATFTRRPGSSLYTLTTAPSPVSASGQVAVSSQVFAAASRSSLASAPCSCRPLSHETLLWHHHLGHPSLPRLRGMASLSLRAAPHSSLFPPTKAPLQTLHMDVWGPARVRGQGHERYFLLVVDDHLRYTTVFPLRSKGEVLEVLIDWIRGALRLLSESFGSDLPVLRLYSDRGGEFSSDLLRAFCRLEGIRQTITLPASPQQNEIDSRAPGAADALVPGAVDSLVCGATDSLAPRAAASMPGKLGAPGVSQATEAALCSVWQPARLPTAPTGAKNVSARTNTPKPPTPSIPLTKLLGRWGLTGTQLLLALATTKASTLRGSISNSTTAAATSTTAAAASTAAAAASEAPTPATTATSTTTPSASSTVSTTAPTVPSTTLAPLALAGAAPPTRSRRSPDLLSANEVDSSSRSNKVEKGDWGTPLKERGARVTARSTYSNDTLLSCSEALL
ncbi:unnamed protein product [Closterium sp. NIES-54]